MDESTSVLVLDSERNIISGSVELLNSKIASGGDLRISTGFLHNEHIDPKSDDDQLIVETSAFQQTLLIDGKWSAYFMTLRQPVALREGFGTSNALSLFLYNQNGQQALARLILDGMIDESVQNDKEDQGFTKMNTIDVLDTNTLGISKNFIYDFEFYNFFVNDSFKEIYANHHDGICTYGDINHLADSYGCGKGIKIAVKGLSTVLWGDTGHEDEIYIHCGSSYYYTRDQLMITNTLPFISVPAHIPLTYKSQSFCYCWIVARSDGKVQVRSYNPFERNWQTRTANLSIRWFEQKQF
jgi:hypothetical protein